jgi:hypothetical protein
MAAIVFPSSPATNQVFAASGSAWFWDGDAWRVVRDTNLNAQLGFANISCGTATAPSILFTNGEILTEPVEAPPSPFLENLTTVIESYTIVTGKNALSVGPMTVNDGVTVTVSSGQRWLVV